VLTLWAVHRNQPQRLRWLLVAVIPISALAGAYIGGLFGISLVALLLLLHRLQQRADGDAGQFAGLLATVALLTLLGSEVFTLSDRMNTVFKLHFEAWLLLALACALVLPDLRSRPAIGAAAIAIAILLLTLPTSVHALLAWWRDPKVQTPASLDGMAFLAARNPDEAKVVALLNGVARQPTMLEAAGPPYQGYSRVSSFKGQPTLLGWEFHVWQHGHSWDLIRHRRDQVRAAYLSTEGAAGAERLGVRYAVLCPRERDTYGAAAGAHWPEAGWVPLLRAGQCEIWRTGNDAKTP
ncbi:MAG: DUF2298 domain-containing protein, partial [Chromatocurvus sp.]